jgi:hypothetical protein
MPRKILSFLSFFLFCLLWDKDVSLLNADCPSVLQRKEMPADVLLLIKPTRWLVLSLIIDDRYQVDYRAGKEVLNLKCSADAALSLFALALRPRGDQYRPVDSVISKVENYPDLLPPPELFIADKVLTAAHSFCARRIA